MCHVADSGRFENDRISENKLDDGCVRNDLLHNIHRNGGDCSNTKQPLLLETICSVENRLTEQFNFLRNVLDKASQPKILRSSAEESVNSCSKNLCQRHLLLHRRHQSPHPLSPHILLRVSHQALRHLEHRLSFPPVHRVLRRVFPVASAE